MRPRVASLLLRRMGGVRTPVTRQPVLSTLCCSTNSTAATGRTARKARKGRRVGTGGRNWVRGGAVGVGGPGKVCVAVCQIKNNKWD